MLGLLTRKKPSATDAPSPAPVTKAAAMDEVLIAPKPARRSQRHITFAIDQTGIQMAVSKRSTGRPKLLDIRKVYFPAGADIDQTRAAFITRTVDDYIRQNGGHRATISISITGGDTAFRTFHMPAIKGKGFASAVSFEAKKQLPFPVQDCQYDFRPIYRTKVEGREGIRVALLAATKRLVADQLAPFDQIGFQIHQVYHAQDVVGALLRNLPDFAEDRHYTLVNVERHRTEISYYRGTTLEFYHICSVGSSFLANRSDLTIFEYFAESLAGEIQNSLDYYSGHYSGVFTTRIYIYGDLSYTDELINLLHEHFGYEFRRFPTEELTVDMGSDPSTADSLSVSLPVLAAALNTTQLANLLPPDRRQTIERTRNNRTAVFGLVGLVALLAVIWLGLRGDLSRTQTEFANTTHQVDTFKSSELYSTYNLLKRQIVSRQAYLTKSAPTPSYLALSLKELSLVAPRTVKFRTLNFKEETPERNLLLIGTISASPTPGEVTLAELVENLSASPLYRNVTVIGYSKHPSANGQELDFQIGMKGLL
ncbi:MAG: pilus assembly protein PilM [Candidatus Zixiibacteriota bacterium]